MNENQLTIVRDSKFDEPLIHIIDSINDNCIRDRQKKVFTHLNKNLHMKLILQIIEKMGFLT